MNKTILEVNDAIDNLQVYGLSSLAVVKVLNFVTIPRSYDEIHEMTGVDRTVVRKMIIKHPSLFIKKQVHTPNHLRGRGRPPVKIMATVLGKEIIKKAFY
jgi:hypothetical protein